MIDLFSDESLQRHRAFFEREAADRPLIGSWLFPFFVDRQFPELAASLRPGEIRPADIAVEPFLRDVERLADAYAQLNDDYPLALGAFYGVPWMEAIMGCPIRFSGDSMWAEPCIADWGTFDFERPDLRRNAWFQKLLELLDALIERAGDRVFCSPTLMRGVTDMCAGMRGSSALPVDVLESPERIGRLAEICAGVWIEVARAQLERIPESDCGHVIGGGCMRYWAPRKGVWLQDDAIELLSPAVYREIFLPHVRRIAREFTVAFHLHGSVVWPVDILLELDEIDVLQVTSDEGVDRVVDAWKKIQQRKPCIAFVHAPPDDEAQWRRTLTELFPTALSIQTFAPTLTDAKALRDRVHL